MKKRNITKSPICVHLYVTCFQGQSFRFLLCRIGFCAGNCAFEVVVEFIGTSGSLIHNTVHSRKINKNTHQRPQLRSRAFLKQCKKKEM